MARLLSSRKTVALLERNGFYFISQRGSHAKYRSATHTVIVPMNQREIPLGTLRSIIRQSGLDSSLFI